jgi:hypothetical protein
MDSYQAIALQAAEKVEIRIRICLQAYRYSCRINRALRRWRTDLYFFRNLFSDGVNSST